MAKAGTLAVTATGGVGVAPACSLASGACALGDVTAEGEFVTVRLSVPAAASPGSVRVTTVVSARGISPRTAVHLLDIKKSTASPGTPTSGTPTPSASSPVPSAPSSSAPQPAPGTTPYTSIPYDVPQASPSNVPTAAQLPPIVADTPQPMPSSQNVAALRPASDRDHDFLVRIQAIWLGILLALFIALSLHLRRPAPGAHRRSH